MVRTIIQLTDAQAQMLREKARDQGVSMAELVRQGVDMVLRSGVTNAQMRRRAREAVGFVKDAPDLSETHDRRLAEAYTDGASQ